MLLPNPANKPLLEPPLPAERSWAGLEIPPNPFVDVLVEVDEGLGVVAVPPKVNPLLLPPLLA